MGKNDLRPGPSSGRGIEDDVKDLIEKCLQLYMSMEEVMIALGEHFNIEPHLTFLVWKKLEEDNPRFFRDYYIRLKLIKQITRFNRLLEQQQQYELMLQEAFRKPTPPQSEPAPDIAGRTYQQQLSNAMTVQYGDGGMHGYHCASNKTTAVASMESPVQAHSLHSINRRELLTHASLEQSMPSNFCVPFDPPGICEQGANPTPFYMQNQGHPASSSSPNPGEFETEADQLDSLDFLLDSPEHYDTGQLPDVPPEPHPARSQTPGKTY